MTRKKSEKGQEVTKLVGVAYERDMARELGKLAEAFDEWRAGSLETAQLNTRVHEYHDGTARRLWVTYNRLAKGLALAQAVAKGVVKPDEVPSDVMEDIAGLLEEVRKQDDDATVEDD